MDEVKTTRWPGFIVTIVLSALSFLSFSVSAQNADSYVYKVNPGDILEIFVWNEEELGREVLVQPDGAVRFPLVGEVMAGGNSLSFIESSISQGLKKYLKDSPVVTVSLKSAIGSKVYVIGNVNRPGEYPVNGRIDVVQAIALAGGLNAFAAEKDIRVLERSGDGKLKSSEFSYADIEDGRFLDSNKLLNSGDTVIVP